MAAIILTPSSRPQVASAGLAPRNAPRFVLSDRGVGPSLRGPSLRVGPSLRGEAPRGPKPSSGRRRALALQLMQDDPFQRVARVVPRRPLQRAPGVAIARLPAKANPGRPEIDVLGVVFIVQPRGEELHDVHAREAPVLGQILDERTNTDVVWPHLEE